MHQSVSGISIGQYQVYVVHEDAKMSTSGTAQGLSASRLAAAACLRPTQHRYSPTSRSRTAPTTPPTTPPTMAPVLLEPDCGMGTGAWVVMGDEAGPLDGLLAVGVGAGAVAGVSWGREGELEEGLMPA